MASGDKIRRPVVADSFYPDNPWKLKSLLENYFSNTKRVINEKIKALIIPHAGYIYSGQTAAWGYNQLPKTGKKHFVLIGPSHFYPFSGLKSAKSNLWETPLGKVKQIPVEKEDMQIFLDETPHLPEHSLEVQLPFLQYLFEDFSISCFLTGDQIESEKVAQYFLNNFSSSVFIISSDLSHFLPEQQAKIKDQKTIEKVLKLDKNYFLEEENVACGEKGILILTAMAKKKNWKGRLLYYDTSATTSGDKSSVVGYSSIGFYG